MESGKQNFLSFLLFLLIYCVTYPFWYIPPLYMRNYCKLQHCFGQTAASGKVGVIIGTGADAGEGGKIVEKGEKV